MRKHAITVIDESDPRVVHVLNMPTVGEHGFYRQTTSLNAFFYSDKRRNQSPNALFVCELWHEFELRREKWNAIEYKISRTFNSIWEFYEFIRYDYKSKKYAL